MDRDDYMRLKGELVTASEALGALRSEQRRAHEAMQRWTAALHSTRVTAERAGDAHALVDTLLELAGRQATLEEQIAAFQRALAAHPIPPV